MSPAVKRLIRSLEHRSEAFTLDDVVTSIKASPLALDDVAEYLRFDREHYRRNPVYRTDAFEILIMCWAAGQSSPIHDHTGSLCGVRVLTGTMLERQFELVGGVMQVGDVVRYRAGTVCGSQDADIHEIVNPDGKADLVTMHLYAPPLGEVNVYESDGTHSLVDVGEVASA